MALVTETLLGTEDKVQHAIETLQAFCPQEGYYVAFSGGKDSVTIKALCDMAGVKYDAHYRVTSIDPPELVRFIKTNYPDVSFDYPRYPDGTRINMWNLIVKHKTPPTRIARYCCEELKEVGGYGRMTVTGVRWAESVNRRKNQGIVTIYDADDEMRANSNFFQQTPRGGVILNNDNGEAREYLESCYRLKKTVVNPIIDWEDEDVWEFIHKHNIPYCDLYDKGRDRLGCVGCPQGGNRQMTEDFERYPKYKNAYLLAFDKMLKARAEKGMKTMDIWDSPEGVLDWWLGNRSSKSTEIDGQMEMEINNDG